MKCSAIKINRGAMAKATNDVWVSNAIQRDGFILEVGNQGTLEFLVRSILEKKIESFDYNDGRSAFGSGMIERLVDFRVTPSAEAVEDVVPAIESTLLKLELRHLLS